MSRFPIPTGGTFVIIASILFALADPTRSDAAAPDITNTGATGIGTNSATLNGTLVSDGGAPTVVCLRWGTTDGGTTPANWTGSSTLGVRSVGAFTTNISGLIPNTIYYYRSSASNADGVSWAPVSTSFKTAIQPTLVVWNKLGDLNETTNSLVGPDPVIKGSGTLTFGDGQFGGAMVAPTNVGLMFNPAAMPGPNHAATYEMWINPPASLPASILNHFLFGCQQTTALGGMALWMNTDRRLYMDLTAAPGSSLLLSQPLTAPLAAGRWYHLALTWDFANTIDGTRTFMAFTNGAVSFQSTVTKSTIYPLGINPAADNFALHGSAYGHRWVAGFVGAIDEFKAWNGVITNFSDRLLDNGSDAAPLAVTNLPAPNIQATATSLRGEVLGAGSRENPVIKIFWGRTDGGAVSAGWSNCLMVGQQPVGQFAKEITGLLPNTQYHYRCFASNSAGAVWAPTSATFTTAADHSTHLVLWNRLGNLEEATNSVVGPDPVIKGSGTLAFGVGQFDGAMVAPTNAGLMFNPVAMPGPNHAATYEIWINPPASLPTSIPNHFLFGCQQTTALGGMALWMNTDRRLYMDLTAAPGSSLLFTQPLTAPLIAGQWYHLALTWDFVNTIDGTRTFMAFTNGAVSFQSTVTRNTIYPLGINPAADNFALHGSAYGHRWVAGFVGAMDEFKVWDCVITDFSDRFVNGAGGGGALATVTLAAANVKTSTVELRGEVAGTGGHESPSVRIYWGTYDGGNSIPGWAHCISIGQRPIGPFAANLADLAPNTRYYYRCYASNSTGIAWSPDSVSFTTEADLSSHLVLWNRLGNLEEATNSVVGPDAVIKGAGALAFDVGQFGGCMTAPTNVGLMFNPALMPGPNHAATYEMWIKPPGVLAPSIPNHFLFGCQQSTGQGGMALWMNTDRRLYMDLTAAPGSSLLLTQPLSTPLAADQWYHLALTWDFANTVDGTHTFKAFTNGVLSFQSTVTKSTIYPLGANAGNDNFALHGSAYNHKWVSGFAGGIDEFKVWDCVITNFGDRFGNGSDGLTPPTVVTLVADGIQGNSAVLGGEVLDTSGHENPVVTVYWGQSDGGMNSLAWAHVLPAGAQPVGVFTVNLTGLSVSSRYYYRCFVSSSAGSAWASNSVSFTTHASPASHLVLWNRLGGPDEATNSVVGPDPVIRGAGTLAFGAGQFGGAMVAPTNAGLMFNPVAMPGPNHAATYEIWINPPASLPASIPNHFLFGCQQTTALGGMALWMNTDRRLYMDLTAAPGSSLLLTQPLTAPLAAGQWYHLALTWDFANTIDGTRTFMAFTNGAVSFQSTVTKSTIYPLGINPTADNFALHGSAYDHRWVSGFVGAMDEFKVWDCVITNFSNRFRDESGNTNSMSVANVAAGSVGSTSAQLQGQLLDTGGHENPAIRIYWGATDGQTNPLAWAHCETLGTRSLGVFDATVTGLTPGLKYYFRCNASSSASSAWAVNSAEFTTLPVFTILASSGSGGTITPSGAVNVQGGQNVNFLVQSEADAYVAEVKVDGQPIGVFGPGTTTVHHAFAGIATNHTIAAAFNHPPTIGLRVSATNGIAPLRVLFDFTASTDADGNIVRAEVDRSGDDTYDASCEGAGQVLVEFGAPGRFTSQARIIDAYGITSQDTVTIEVFGAAPDASLSVQPTNPVAGTMVLLVGTNSTAAIGHQIAIYEWDIDGNGAYEIISQTGSVSCAYGTTGQYPVVLRVTDDQGLQDSASTLITVTPATLPPTVVLSANPDYGEVPAFIRFIAAASDDGYATQFRWDFNGDGTIDMLSTTSSVSHVYTQVGNFQAKVTVVDDSGLSASATVSIAIKQGSQMKVWISEPKDSGASDGVPHIWGAAVTLVAHAARSASDAESLQFKYRLAGAPTWVNIGMPLYPAPHAFKSTWDVTALTPGACYELIAVATDYDSSMVTSEIVTVIVDPDENKTPGHGNEHLVDGKHTKEATFGRDKTADMQLYDGTRVQVPPETIDDNPTVSIELTGQNTNQVNGSAKGMSSINANRKVSLDGKPDLGKPITILVPYPDSDEDGVVDGTTVPETTLTVHWFDNYEGKWKKVLAQTVDTKANCAKFTTYHLTEFGLFGSVNLLEPAHGGILMSHPQAYTNTTLAGNVTDGNKVSFWRSKTAPDAPQVFVYAFTNYCGAILDEAILSNYGEAGLGKALYSRDFSVQTSMDGTDFKSVAGGTLTAQEEPQTFAIGSVTCRVVKLVISNGVDETAWELSEFALHGKLTPDPDADGMPDEWEAKYFGEFGRDGNGDWDADGIKDKPEYDMGTDPTRKDSDGDGVNDWHEWMAGTSSTDGHSFFKAGQDMSPAEGMIVRWHTMTGRIYRVLGTTNMVVGAWSNLSPVITGNGAEHAFTNKDPSANAKFYRVSVGLQP